jgi:hypothetical protein
MNNQGMSKLTIAVDILESQGYSTEKNTMIGLLTSMFLHCMNGCGKQWHTLYVKDTDNYRYVCDNCKSTVTYVG